MQKIVKQITKGVPRHPQRIVGALEFHVECLEGVMRDEPSYHIERIRALIDELSESLLLAQLIASAKELNLSVPSPDQVVPTSGGNPTPLYFSDFSAWPEVEELSPAERQEIRRCGDEIV